MKHFCKNSIGARHFQHLLVSMKFTCLNKGSGYYFPPSYILDVSGFRILLDCPLDISALTIFSPLTTQFHPQFVNESSRYSSMDMEFEIHKRQKIEQPLDRGNFIHAEPWYKTVTSLHLWDPSSIDIVLISSMTGMLGLPFLTRNKGFSAKIYATEATASLGQLMMKDLVSMHSEFVHIYGLEPNFPQWLKWEELELLPSPLKEIAFGKDGLELGGWRPLYSSEDVQVCIQKVEIVKYAEETCYNGALILKAFSSGLEIGSCNWTIDSADADIASVSSSMFASNVATEFNYHALQGKDLILYSDFSANENMEDFEHGNKYNAPTMHTLSTLNDSTVDCKNVDECLLNSEELLEERDKLAFVCSCVVDSVRAGGSVLVALVQPSISLQLLEQIPDYLESSAMRVPVYVISSIASELLAFTNIVPEWLCKQRQEKLFSCQSLFSYAQHLKEKKLHLFPSIHSTELLTNWQEPCIIFASHWSLRLGPVVHLLQRWHGDRNSLLVLEKCVGAEMSLLPFKPMEMKVLECSFQSGIRLRKTRPLLEILQPKILLFPGDFKEKIKFSSSSSHSFSVLYFTENDTLDVPRMKESFDMEIEAELATRFVWKKLTQDDIDIARLEGQLYVSQGKHQLHLENKLASTVQTKSLVNWVMPDLERLLVVLSDTGINASIDKPLSDADVECTGVVQVKDPTNAKIEFHSTKIIVTAPDENLAKLISEAITSILES